MKKETERREIEALDYYLQNHTNDYSEESHMAMMMAVKALEQEPCEDEEYEKDLNELKEQIFKEGNTLISKQDLLERFVEIDNEYKNSHWNLLQILANIDILIGKEPCEDAVSRQAVIDTIYHEFSGENLDIDFAKVLLLQRKIKALPSVNQQKIGYCKDCKYFEYDSVAKVGGIPLIVAHEICNKWGDGCKTSEEGFCFLFEPQESEGT